jgi:glycosyltransferase involved in cell wall biosynthesis
MAIGCDVDFDAKAGYATRISMTATLRLSIVTPSFNQGAFIREAVDSVCKQNYTDCEHIVVDGGSTDGTVASLQELGQNHGASILRWSSEPDRGQAHALNKGFALATGDIIGWLNSDDRYRPGAFHKIARIFERHPEIDLVYGDYTWMNAHGGVRRVRREIPFNRFILLYHRVLYIPTTATFFRRRIIDEGNRLDECLQYALDFDFFLRLSARRYRFMHVREILADFRLHDASKTCSTPERQLQELNDIMRRHSPVADYTNSEFLQNIAFGALGLVAGALRYSQKLVTGCYLPTGSLTEPPWDTRVPPRQ